MLADVRRSLYVLTARSRACLYGVDAIPIVPDAHLILRLTWYGHLHEASILILRDGTRRRRHDEQFAILSAAWMAVITKTVPYRPSQHASLFFHVVDSMS